MKLYAIALGVFCAAGLSGQQTHMNWQNYCFSNPTAPFCPQRDFAGKKSSWAPTPPSSSPLVTSGSGGAARPASHTGGFANSNAAGANAMAAAQPTTAIGDAIWQFAEPNGDAVAGFRPHRLASRPVTRALLFALGAQRGVSEADMQKQLDKISAVDEAALLLIDGRVVAALTGPAANTISTSAPSAKTMPLYQGAALIGQAPAVDEAARRIALNIPPTGGMRMAEDWQARTDFWVIGAGSVLGSEAASTGLMLFYITAWAGDSLTVDMTFDFAAPLQGEALRKWQAVLGPVAPEGNRVHWRASVDAEELPQKLAQITASPLGQSLAALVQASRALPAPAVAAPKKPMIFGLDNGPRTLGGDSH